MVCVFQVCAEETGDYKSGSHETDLNIIPKGKTLMTPNFAVANASVFDSSSMQLSLSRCELNQNMGFFTSMLKHIVVIT